MSRDPETFPMPTDPIVVDGIRFCYLPTDFTQSLTVQQYRWGPSDMFWRDRVPFLRTKGYSLRRRYQPHWLPEWPNDEMNSTRYEDSWPHLTGMVLDAYCRESSSLVAIKCVASARVEHELAIHRFLTSKELLQDPQNHCAPLLDVFQDAEGVNLRGEHDLTFLVTPYLYDFDQWGFETVDNALDFVSQTLEAISFMHSHGVAHRDCAASNIRVDASGLYPSHWPHPAFPQMDYCPPWRPLIPPNRAAATVRYYLIDFGESSRRPDDNDGPFLVTGSRCIDPELPEAQLNHPYDPFPVDVFLLGNTYKHSLLEKYRGLDMLQELVEAMTRQDPTLRPDAARALNEFRSIYAQTSWVTRRARLWPANFSLLDSVSLVVAHAAVQTFGFVRNLVG